MDITKLLSNERGEQGTKRRRPKASLCAYAVLSRGSWLGLLRLVENHPETAGRQDTEISSRALHLPDL